MLATDPALQTFAALFLGHVAADYLFQTGWMVANKGRAAGLGAHVAVVFAMTLIAVGGGGVWAVLLLTLVHAAMDVIKARLLPQGPLWPYMLDQGVHTATAIAIAALFPNTFAEGIWPWLFGADWTPVVLQAALIVAGAVFAIEAGNHAIAIILDPMPRAAEGREMAGSLAAGRRIGQLERGLTYLFVLMGQPLAIVILAAAKLLLRAGGAARDRVAGEYVVLGTLASLGWAIATGMVIRLILDPATLESLAVLP